jgi:hypothetical protein
MVRPVFDAGDVIGLRTEQVYLPAGYFVVDVLTITADTGTFEGTSGPIGYNLNCGTGYRIPLKRTKTGWKVGDEIAIVVC